ncbi:hypothetical protein PRNP1_011606 [Phytophthora ramorum]
MWSLLQRRVSALVVAVFLRPLRIVASVPPIVPVTTVLDLKFSVDRSALVGSLLNLSNSVHLGNLGPSSLVPNFSPSAKVVNKCEERLSQAFFYRLFWQCLRFPLFCKVTLRFSPTTSSSLVVLAVLKNLLVGTLGRNRLLKSLRACYWLQERRQQAPTQWRGISCLPFSSR